MLERAGTAANAVAFDVRTDNFKSITEITVYVPDHPRLLALLTGACAAGDADVFKLDDVLEGDGLFLGEDGRSD